MPTEPTIRAETGADEPLPARTETELRQRRRRITQALLGGLTVLGAIAYVPSVWAAVQVGALSIVVLDTLVYAAVVAAFLHPRLSHTLKAATAVIVAAVLGVTLSVVFGPNGAGAIYLCAVPVLTALLFGRRATLTSLAFLALSLAVIAALRAADVLAWDVTPGGTLLWLVISGNVLVIAGALALGVATLIAGLTEAAERTERYGAALAREQAELLEVNDRLERVIAERARAEWRLRQTEKLTAVGTLASGIAHDMNNLLVPILAGTELLRAEKEGGDDRAEILGRIAGAAGAARDLVQRILAFSEPGSEERRPVDAATVFQDAARLLRAALPGDVELAFSADPDTGTILLSNAEAHQIVLNLGTNAAQAMPDGGRLTIAVDPVAAGNEPPDCPAPRSGRFVLIMVTDEGVGMDQETLARIFEPFFSRRNPTGGQGHGIGLATVYGIVSSAGGFVRPHSQPGAGTVMEVYLPVVDESPRSVVAPAERAPSGHGERVLVVDDDEDVRVMAIRILEYMGYRAAGVEGAEAALLRLERDYGFDLVLTDLAMPHTDGLELVATLRERDPALPVVIMSGLLDHEVRQAAAALDVDGLLRKPFEVDDVAAIVATALEGRRVSNG